MESETAKHIGFAPPLLGERPQRLAVAYDRDGILALLKPTGILVTQDNWYPRLPVLVEAIRWQAEQGKPELQRLGIGPEGLWALHGLDPELAGPVLFARERAAAEAWRNSIGSDKVCFQFGLIAASAGAQVEACECELPVARHATARRVLVSHTTGKRARTQFERVGGLPRGLALWQAQTTQNRLHQVRLHAYEVGLRTVGDPLYGGSGLPYLSEIKTSYRPAKNREEKPLLDGPAVWLQAITGEGIEIRVAPPPRIAGYLRQLDKL